MFERYTEGARRSIFFARYEASQFGAREITTEHLLLGLLRDDSPVIQRLLSLRAGAIRRQIEEHNPPQKPIPTNIDLPLTEASKRVLAYAAEEAERLHHRYIGSEHLLLGLLREEECLAAQILRGHGVRLPEAGEDIARD